MEGWGMGWEAEVLCTICGCVYKYHIFAAPLPHHHTYILALQPPPLHQSPKRLREQEDTSSLWHRCPTPLHWWRECPCVLPVTTWDRGCPFISPSCLVWNSVEQFHTFLCHVILWRCLTWYTCRHYYTYMYTCILYPSHVATYVDWLHINSIIVKNY